MATDERHDDFDDAPGLFLFVRTRSVATVKMPVLSPAEPVAKHANRRVARTQKRTRDTALCRFTETQLRGATLV